MEHGVASYVTISAAIVCIRIVCTMYLCMELVSSQQPCIYTIIVLLIVTSNSTIAI